jgi:DNA-binding NarL/FixJ family response regulator
MAAEVPHSSKADHLHILKGVSVLVAEASMVVARAMKTVLQQLEMSVIGPAGTTEEAHRLAKEENRRLAIVDLNLEDGSSRALISQLQSRGVPLVVVSGLAGPQVSTKMRSTYLQKPFSANEFIAAICAVVGCSGVEVWTWSDILR